MRPLVSTTSTIAGRRPRIGEEAGGRDAVGGDAEGSHGGVDEGGVAAALIGTGTKVAVTGASIEMPGSLPSRASLNHERHTSWRSATAEIVAPGASASDMILSFSSLGQ